MLRTAVSFTLNACEQALLEKIARQLTVPKYQKQRIRAVLAAATGLQNKNIAEQILFNRNEVGKWRKSWLGFHSKVLCRFSVPLRLLTFVRNFPDAFWLSVCYTSA